MKAPAPSAPDVFYPIVPDVGWLERLLPLGVRTVQLRIKDAPATEIRSQIAAAIQLTRNSPCQLIVNDYWRIAIDLGANFIHLGQEDLAGADVAAIRAAGARIGISTHSDEELETALAAGPAYVALGPIYETRLKAMRWAPQGLERITEWKRRVGTLPLVAIGGITPERAGAVVAAGADSLAIITDFMSAPNPQSRVRLWLEWASTQRGGGDNERQIDA